MDFTGEHRIPASREDVWNALNDPEILRRSLPGCQALEQTGENEFTATMVSRIGPVSATFKGKVELADIDPPNSYRLIGRGQGGPAGFAKGSAKIVLESVGPDTVLHYHAEVDVGGKLASIGSRLMTGVADTMANEFFARLSRAITGDQFDQIAADGALPKSALPPAVIAAGRLPMIDRVAWLLVGIGVGVGLTLRALGHI